MKEKEISFSLVFWIKAREALKNFYTKRKIKTRINQFLNKPKPNQARNSESLKGNAPSA